ncbi:Bax inhibitor-1/YccA family protein [Pseudonocardia nantongensis]|uniref:Bax inhibitor-1/YccA family protein n=1 Tax=Pseudonocardia nantongensis TaxID=1181885 RepID=UPI0039793B07
MRSTSNPAFRNLPTQQGGYATFDRSGGGMMGGGAALGGAQSSYVDPSQTTQDTGRPITIDDIVQKTAISGGLALVAGFLTVLSGLYVLALPAFIVGIVVSLIVIFKQKPSAPLTLTYSIAMGIALGGITGVIQDSAPQQYAGIGLQAVIGTAGVFFGMLVVYKTGAVKVTPRFTKWLMGAMIGVVVLMVANLVASFFTTGGMGLRDGSPLAILFSIVVIGVAAFSLLLDFDAADNAVKAGVPEKYSWYIAFGLMTTLVWLYIEILRLLSYLRGD